MSATTASDRLAFLASPLRVDVERLEGWKAEAHRDRTLREALHAEARRHAAADLSPEDALRQAAVLYVLSRPEPCLAVLEGAPKRPETALLRGLASLQMGDPATAVEELATLVGTPLEQPTFLVTLATAAALAGDADLAHKAAGRLKGGGADALYAEAVALEAEGEYAEAVARYRAALEQDPEHRRTLFRLALRMDFEGRDAEAIELYRRCTAVTPTSINALLNLALLYEDAGRYNDAESCYRRILAVDPQHARARIGLKDVLESHNMFYDEERERREDREAQILRTQIAEFELSVRSRNCLARMNVVTLGDLVRKTEHELLAYKNFGETSLQEIKDILAQKGLKLGMMADDDAPLLSPAGESDADDEVAALFGGPAADDPLLLPIEELDLSPRAERCLEGLDVDTVGDLLRHSEEELLASKNFGQTSLDEIRRKLDQMGLTLRTR